ncbi:hypothetical protein [Actibacterium sp. XHP0104]|uniref:hypothetical protein n=1 Tax=Actibacterium sp. XHP0104 TaxID=2984335 RepID=UPI0021E6F00F|nr:hypothetical protein [Actibacterium sp. XHP0104]MCV2882024.1 hypothetical protein [Actibacterium sp. XHP0104]
MTERSFFDHLRDYDVTKRAAQFARIERQTAPHRAAVAAQRRPTNVDERSMRMAEYLRIEKGYLT